MFILEIIEDVLTTLAFSSISYAIALYISFASDTFEDKGSYPKLVKFLSILSYPFFFLGLGGVVVFGPYEHIKAVHLHNRQHEAMKLVKFIAETNRMDKEHQEGYWERNRFLYKTELDYDTWKRNALREYGYYYDEFFHD